MPDNRPVPFQKGTGNPYQYNNKDFAYILNKIGAPVNPQNLRVMSAWRSAEGGTYNNNPFNTTQSWQGATGGGVKNYQTRQQGLDATVDTLTNAGARQGGRGYYAGVLQGFRSSNPDQTIKAIVQSPWAGSHYGGRQNWQSSSLYGAYTGRKSSGPTTPIQPTSPSSVKPISNAAPSIAAPIGGNPVSSTQFQQVRRVY
jgi:hypothetical protein